MFATDPDALIAAVGNAMGMPSMHFDAKGCCRLMFDGSQLVELYQLPAQQRWLLSCALRKGALNATGLRLLLQSNFYGPDFDGGWVGMDPSGRAVLYLPVLQSQVSAAVLLDAIELLLTRAEHWEQRLSEAGAPTSGHSSRRWV